MLRRLDHVAIAVWDTEAALVYFRDRLALPVVHTEELAHPRVRLTYLDAGNVLVQLVEPLDESAAVGHWLAEQGEGLHHICFAVDDDVVDAARALSLTQDTPVAGSGRGRPSAFVPGPPPHGTRIECTAFCSGDRAERGA